MVSHTEDPNFHQGILWLWYLAIFTSAKQLCADPCGTVPSQARNNHTSFPWLSIHALQLSLVSISHSPEASVDSSLYAHNQTILKMNAFSMTYTDYTYAACSWFYYTWQTALSFHVSIKILISVSVPCTTSLILQCKEPMQVRLVIYILYKYAKLTYILQCTFHSQCTDT